jgi:hypothetical protein
MCVFVNVCVNVLCVCVCVYECVMYVRVCVGERVFECVYVYVSTSYIKTITKNSFPLGWL